MSTVGELLRELREERGLTQRQLGERVNLSHESISSREKGRTRITYPEQKRFAQAFGLSIDEWQAKLNEKRRIQQTQGSHGIPVINRAPAGLILNYEEFGVDSGQGFEYIERGDIEDPLVFAVIVAGDSMEPTLSEGDYLVLCPQNQPKPRHRLEPGDVVFVRFTPESEHDGCVLGRWYPQDDELVLLGKDNPSARQIQVRRDAIEQLAVAIEHRKKLKR